MKINLNCFVSFRLSNFHANVQREFPWEYRTVLNIHWCINICTPAGTIYARFYKYFPTCVFYSCVKKHNATHLVYKKLINRSR